MLIGGEPWVSAVAGCGSSCLGGLQQHSLFIQTDVICERREPLSLKCKALCKLIVLRVSVNSF